MDLPKKDRLRILESAGRRLVAMIEHGIAREWISETIFLDYIEMLDSEGRSDGKYPMEIPMDTERPESRNRYRQYDSPRSKKQELKDILETLGREDDQT